MCRYAVLIFGAFLVTTGFMTPVALQAAIFGDGNLENGDEDSRISVSSADIRGVQNYVGVLSCQGQVRGTGLVFAIETQQVGRYSPVILTAAHVLNSAEGLAEEGCYLSPAGDLRKQIPLTKNRLFGGSRDELKSVSLETSLHVENTLAERSLVMGIEQFSDDWAVVAVPAWAGWRNYAMDMDSEFFQQRSTPEGRDQHSAIFIGYDLIWNGLRVDTDCEVGASGQSILAGQAKLVWDSCDSTRGSSGGVLMTLTNGSFQLVGIRVGNIFDADIYPHGPKRGDKFDRDKNINASRVVDDEVVSAMKRLIHIPDSY